MDENTRSVASLSRRRALALLLSAPVCVVARRAIARSEAPIRIGALKYGTAEWELDVITTHGLDDAHGVRVTPVPLASNEAAKIALLGGSVDMIVSDWIWVARQRSDGRALSFIPYSLAVGSLVTMATSPVDGIADLRHLRIGVAGGPLDKSWLLLRALARREASFDPAATARVSFAAPPLLEQQLRVGRLDAVLTYWHSAARLEVDGCRAAIAVADIVRRLGVPEDVPMLGYVFRDAWANDRADLVRGFAAASRKAKALLAESDDEWRRIAPLTGAHDDRTLALLRAGYRDGIPRTWGPAERDGAERLFAYLAETGGRELVGSARGVAPGTFWPGLVL
ncbi:MAG: ABC transporter substrate-binding protein [Gemmatimonas sp.]